MPPALYRAQLLDVICKRWPGYTLSSALNENAELLFSTLNILELAKVSDE